MTGRMKFIAKTLKEWEAEWAKRPWYEKTYDAVRFFFRGIYYSIYSEVHSWPFRFMNGFDYRDTWSLDQSIAEYTYPRLKHLRSKLHGYPDGLTFKKWEKIIDKMLFAFEKVLDEDYLYDKRTDKKVQAGLELFGKYFRNLWD